MDYTPIVCIGASAGGLKELETFFRNLPDNNKAAFMIIQHLSPDHKSVMSEILSRYTSMQVLEIGDGMEAKPGKVYVIPPNKEVWYREGRLLLNKMNRRANRELPIDICLRSLKVLQERAIAVILSGSGTDGSLGLKDLKEAGGLIMVQEPSTADYDGMPNSALSTGLVDFCIKVEDMPETILKYIDSAFEDGEGSREEEEEDDNTLHNMSQVFTLIRETVQHDFSRYKQNTIKRRIERRMTVNGVKTLEAYLGVLKNNRQEVIKLYKELLISVTSFFRDRETFGYIEREVIPKIVKNAQEQQIRVWVPACATGEEAYTWCILLKEYIKQNALDHTVKIFASDIDPDAIVKAREGLYDRNIAVDVPEGLLKTYFLEEENGFRIKPPYREQVVFAEQNLIYDPPYSKLDLISCRNLLIYLDGEAQRIATLICHYALNENGILLLGNAESLGQNSKFYSTLSHKHKVYSKITSPDLPRRIWNLIGKQQKEGEDWEQLPTLQKFVNEHMLAQFAPPSVVVNEEREILYVQGKMGRFLEMTTGAMSNNIVKIAKEGLKVPIANSIRKCMAVGKAIKSVGLKISREEGLADYVNLNVAPLLNKKGLFVISFMLQEAHTKQKNTGKAAEAVPKGQEGLVEELEKELAEKERYLQRIIEELETTNEELKSSNEEAQSTNEELQSTNEELETSREELQSVNEELTTTNAELNNKVDELTHVSNTLQNLMASTNIATVFLDREMRIFQFTPSIAEIIGLIKSDIGRPFAQFTHSLERQGLVADAQKVLQSLVPKSMEVRSKDGKYFWMQINPYRTMEDSIEGVVITFTDITEKREKEEELIAYRKQLEEMVDEKTKELLGNQRKFQEISSISNDVAFSCIVSGDKELKRDWAIGHLYAESLQQRLSVVKIHALPEMVGTRDHKIIAKAFEKVMNGETVTREVRIHTGSGAPRWVRLKAVPIREQGATVRVIGTLNDITKRKNYEMDLVRSEALLKQTERVAQIGSWEWDVENDRVTWSENHFEMFGIDPQEGAPNRKQHADKNLGLYTEQSIARVEAALQELLQGGDNYEIELDAIRRNGAIFRCIARGYAEKDDAGKVVKLYGSVQDITKRKKMEEALKASQREFQNVADSLPGVVLKYAILPNGGEVLHYISKGVEDIYEIPQATALQDVGLLWNMIHKDDLEQFKESIMLSMHNLTLWKHEFRIKLPNGQIKWLQARGVPYKEQDGTVTWDTISLDITEKMQYEASLRESEATFKGIFENGITANVVADDQGNFVMVNKAAAELLGYSQKEMLHMNVRDIVALTPERTQNQYSEFVEEGLQRGEMGLKLKNGNTKTAFYHAIRIKENFNLSVLVDITGLKAALQELEERQQELEKLNDSKDKILAIVGHDMRSPIHQILVLSNLALEDDFAISAQEKDEFMQQMSVLSNNLSSLVDNLLNWALSQMERVSFSPAPFVLADLAAEAMEMVKVLAIRKEISIANTVAQELVAHADPELIKIVLRNLLANAIKFSDRQSEVRLTAAEQGEQLLVSVQDHGVGMSATQLQTLFVNKEVHSNWGTEGEKGTGLGLSVCQEFVYLNGGKIWAESTEGKGTTVFFTLPIHAESSTAAVAGNP